MSRPAPRARRWPDLLIGLLVALLLVGFGLLLFRPENRAATGAVTPTTPATTDTGTPSIPSAPAPSATTPDTSTVPSTSATTEPPTIAAAPVEATQPVTTTPAATPDSTTPSTTATTATPATTTTPRSGGAVAASERRVPLRSDYRITLGTFSSTQAATTGTAPVSVLGYTVYPIDLGSQVVAQVGPYADEATARQALADIQRAYPGALLYPPRNKSLSQSTPSGTQTATPTASATPTAPAVPSGPTYLQVGAFDRVASAQKLVQQLRDLGYSPTVNAPDGKKVTVLVGPYSGDAVTRTESRLSASGLDHFRVR
ncbi:SPOR domain-containing protein [Deinococcus sp. KSM4-11]|uniref:SPOR domain-containing protein n=1 Tax=Deinococcus sp. KSM4-11 TaxID=2568654 RepID=UPI0010A3FF31|nr:SPOR domain-containing protein [Deinococcus sp. KSM4-11]THF88783.1 SPOR domain-containing protein [Deinococcus sp. KSM4-11]